MRAFLKPVDIWKKSKSPSTSWKCNHCQSENSLANRTTCAACGKAAGSTFIAPKTTVSEVECSVCTLLNPSFRTKCEACGSTLTKATAADADPPPQSVGVTNNDDNSSGYIVDPSNRSDRMKSILQPEPMAAKKDTPNKRVNLFETLSNIQRALDKPDATVDEASPPPVPARPLLSSRTSQPLSALAALKRGGDQVPSSSSSLGAAPPVSIRKPSMSIPISASKLKQQNGLLSSISNGSTLSLPPSAASSATQSRRLIHDDDGDDDGEFDAPAVIKRTGTTSGARLASTTGPGDDEIIVLDSDEDEAEKATASFQRIPYQTSGGPTQRSSSSGAAVVAPSRSHTVPLTSSRPSTRLEDLSDDDFDPAPSRTIGQKRPHASTTSRPPATSVKTTSKAARVTTDRIDDAESRSVDESDYGSLDDFIVNSDEDEDGESYTGSDSGSGSGSGSGSEIDGFLDTEDEAEVDAMYQRRDHRRASRESNDEIVISDDDDDEGDARARGPPAKRSSQRRTDAFVIDDGDDNDDIVDRHTPVFDLTAGYVQHTRNDLNQAHTRSEFRELRPTFPRISAHYWSVKQLFKEGCCAINFNLFTLDAGATNPNCIGIQRGASKASSTTGKPALSLEESYTKRRAAKEAKEAKKRRATAARAAKRKRSSSSGKRRSRKAGASAASDDPSADGPGADGEPAAARRASKKRSRFSKARFSRRK